MPGDDLRDLREPDLDFDFEEETSVEEDYAAVDRRTARKGKLFLGMTAVERMFLSIFLFMNVVVLGLAFLLATRRLVF
jgi:hypothetical protein